MYYYGLKRGAATNNGNLLSVQSYDGGPGPFGALTVFNDRSRILRSFLATAAPEYAWASKTGKPLAGYVFGRNGYHHEHVGPLAATSETAAGGRSSGALFRSRHDRF